jgi:hypothetical protein
LAVLAVFDVSTVLPPGPGTRARRNWHKYVTEVSAVNTSRNWHKDSRKREPTDLVGQAMPSYPNEAVMEQLIDCHRVSHMDTSLNQSGMQPNRMCSFWGPAKELSQDIDVLVVVGVAINCCEDQITHIVDDHGLYITFECAHEYMTVSTMDRPLTARFITEVSLRLIRYKGRVANESREMFLCILWRWNRQTMDILHH